MWANATQTTFSFFTCGNRRATCEWIARVISRTNTDSIMIDNTTISIETTSARTWIDAFLINARLLQRTIGYADTFRTTSWRTAKVAGQTRANRLILLRCALTVRATRIRYALIFIASGHRFSNGYAGDLCVSCVARWAATNREMIQNTASSRCAAGADAWIDTFAANTSAIAWTFRVQNTFGTTAGQWISNIV